jgi:pyruvate formate lyase activating enzyme
MVNLMEKRAIPYLTFTLKPIKRAWITLSECNFNCKGCFTIAKNKVGRILSVDELITLFIKSCKYFYNKVIDDVVITGGEPTLYPEYLYLLCLKLKELGIKITLSTNGYLINENLIEKIKSLIDFFIVDLKAYNEEIHRFYTGKDNFNVLKAIRLLHEHRVNFRVETLLIPGIIDVNEIENIAKFLSSIDRKIYYKINEYAPEYTNDKFSRRPTKEEMLKAFNIAKKYLDNIIIGKSCRVENIKNDKYDVKEYEYVKIYSNELLEYIKKSDKISISKYNWKIKYVSMDEILNS